MNVEIWLEDVDADFPTIKLTGETAQNFHVPREGDQVGAWQDEHVKGSESYVLLDVHSVRHYIYKKMNIWTQEVHVMCSNRPYIRRR